MDEILVRSSSGEAVNKAHLYELWVEYDILLELTPGALRGVETAGPSAPIGSRTHTERPRLAALLPGTHGSIDAIVS